MMKLCQGLPVFIVAAAVNLSACSYIQSWFPDKEKDYQYTTEIPELVIPSELTAKPASREAAADQAETPDAAQAIESSGADSLPVEEAGAPVDASPGAEQAVEPESRPSEPGQPEQEAQQAESVKAEPQAKVEDQTAAEPGVPAGPQEFVEQPAQTEADKAGKISADLVVYDDGETRLRIDAEKATAWRMVGKALSRRSIEVVDRNQEEGTYEVQYDPDEQQFKDESYWDEIKFIFGGLKANEARYVLKLIENNRQTDVAVLNQDGKPASDPAGLRLLKLIQKTINADQAK